MIFSQLRMYKVVEMERALCLIDASHNVKDGMPLMQGPREACVEYIDRYTHARERGDNSGPAIEDAHRKALDGAIIVDRIHHPKAAGNA